MDRGVNRRKMQLDAFARLHSDPLDRQSVDKLGEWRYDCDDHYLKDARTTISRYFHAEVTSETLDLDCSVKHYQDDRIGVRRRFLVRYTSTISNHRIKSSRMSHGGRHGSSSGV